MKAAQNTPVATPAKRSNPFFSKGGAQDFFHTSINEQPFFSKSKNNNYGIQTKLTVGAPNDVYEKEADSMADKVVQRLTQPEVISKKDQSVQAKPLSTSFTPFVQKKCAHCEEEEKLQKKSETTSQTVLPPIESRLSSSKGSGFPLSQKKRNQMESSFGADFSKVRIHDNNSAVQMNKDLHAQAFTYGSDIYFNSGKYDINSKPGMHLLAHELMHVVQQNSSVNKKIQRSSDFCTPYGTTAEAANAKWWLRNSYMRAEGIETYGTEVYNLYDSFLSRHPGDSLAPRVFESDSSYIHNSFKDDGFIKDDMDAVIDLIGTRLSRVPGGLSSLRDGVPSTMSLSNFLSTSEMNDRPINFSNPFSVSGHIAGGIGSSDAGDDYRKITYANVTIEKVILFGNTGYYSIELTPHYEVFDTIDFCPGDPGSPLEEFVTTPMSRLEASGEAYDMPFKVIFSPAPRSKRIWF